MSEETEDNFTKGIFWELYKDLERQFQDFLEYVPYLPGNEAVYSVKLLNLILSVGGHIDSAFKEMARYPKFSSNDDCKDILEKVKKKQTVPITLPLKAFETEYTLSEKTIIFKRLPERQNVRPFKPRSARAQSPKWWKIYNGIKHDVGVNIKEANLQTTRDALAGAFLLNAVHYPSVFRLYEYGVLEEMTYEEVSYGTVQRYFYDLKWIKQKYEKEGKLPTLLETPLFIYEYGGWGDEPYEWAT